MTGGSGDSFTKKAISIRGKVRNVGQNLLNDIFEHNPYMKEIYPENARHALEVFQLYEGQGEYFDLSSKPIYRDTFTLGGKEEKHAQYKIDESCIGCDECAKVCPQNCIDKAVPYFIRQENCLHCGLCLESCRSNAIQLLITMESRILIMAF
jgi:ferredoxin